MNTVKCSNRLCEKEYSVEFDKCPFCGTPNPMEESERKAMIEKSKATDIRNSSSDESLFNGWVTGIIWVNIIFFGARGIISSFTNMIFSPLIGWITLGLSIVGIISLLYILSAKKWAFFLWIAYRIAGAVVVSIINPKFSLTAHIIFAVVNILVMIAVLQIKKNGVSAWSVIFSKHKSSTGSKKSHHIIKRRNNINDSEPSKSEIKSSNEPMDSFKVGETQCTIKENELSTPIPTPATNEVQEEIPPTIMPNEQPVEKDDHSQSNEMSEKPRIERCKKKTLKYNKWWIYLLILVGILAIALLAVWLSHRFSKPELGEYVYVDDYNILHLDRNCSYIATNRGTRPVTIYSLKDLDFRKWQQVCSHCVSDKGYRLICEYSITSKKILPNEEPMSNNSKRNMLYYNLLGSGKVTESEIGTLSEFKAAIKDEASAREFYSNLINSGLFSTEEIGNEDDFYESICSDFEQQDNLKLLYETLKKDGVVKKDYDYFYKYLQNENNRKLLYNALKADNYNVPDSYESFRRTLFETETSSR